MHHGPQLLHLLATGGTMEKVYREQTGSVVNDQSKIDRYLARLRLPETEVRVTHLMNKDSLDMTDADRELVLHAIQQRLDDRVPILISHGTDTMVETGLFLKKRLTALTAPIILTGAMIPLGFEGTDGLQNLTESLLAARLLPPGIYVVMHNEVFPVSGVRKDRELGRFIPLPYTQ